MKKKNDAIPIGTEGVANVVILNRPICLVLCYSKKEQFLNSQILTS